MDRLAFDFPLALKAGLPLAALVIALFVVVQWRRGTSGRRIALSIALRALVLFVLVFLAARPVWEEPGPKDRSSVILLVDRSASMSLEDGGAARFERVIDFARQSLLPALKQARLRPQAFLFAEDAEKADGKQLAEARPEGSQTNLAWATVRALGGNEEPPLAVVALTDGASNVTRDNARALSAMLESQVAFVGIGFGSEMGVQTLSLQRVICPPTVPPNQEFQISAQLEMSSTNDMPPFDLLLMRGGQLFQRKTIQAGKGQRFWLENFSVKEDQVGDYAYSIQLQPPLLRGLRCPNALAEVKVRVLKGGELRVLFAQGSLSWDYKFIRLALRGDPTIQLTGLTRTSKNTFFHQDVEREDELSGGFPTTLEELAPFRVVVLSNFKPIDLSPAQQDLLKRYCAEFGGGVLMTGGPETFDSTWQSSPLEQLLPVRFASRQFASTSVRSIPPGQKRGVYRIGLTGDALDHPVFKIVDTESQDAAWGRLPLLISCAEVEREKQGAQVWATYSNVERSDQPPRILIAQQRFGAGLSAVVCTDNLWMWRLAREGDPEQYDRFWRQFLQHLSETGASEIAIRFPDQDLRPGEDIRAVIERRPDPAAPETPKRYIMRVKDAGQETIKEQELQIAPGRRLEVAFKVNAPGVHAIEVLDASTAPQATRTFEVKDMNVEYQHPSRDMESLRQWASLTGGAAVKAEDCESPGALIQEIKARADADARKKRGRMPAGINGWVLALLLGCLCAEWGMRKRWGLP